jgi:hypothetical protein
MTVIYFIGIILGVILIRTTYVFVRFRRLAALQKQQLGHYLSEGLEFRDAIAEVLSDLSRERGLGLTEATINTVTQKLAGLASMMDSDNVADILAQFTQRYILVETRIRLFHSAPMAIDNAKIVYAAEHLDLQERNGYFLIRPSTHADFTTKYPGAH